MDPISAFSFAATIFQVVDFSAKVVSVATQIYKSGSSSELNSLEQAGQKLQSAVEILASQCPVLDNQCDPTITHLIDRSQRLSQEIS